MDAAKSVSPVCIPSVGLAPIDTKTKGGDSGGAPYSKTATKLGRLGPVVRGQEGPFPVDFCPIDLKPL
jgi:hypothetical protein